MSDIYDTPLDTTHRQLRLTVIVDYPQGVDEHDVQMLSNAIQDDISKKVSYFLKNRLIAAFSTDNGGTLYDADAEGNTI